MRLIAWRVGKTNVLLAPLSALLTLLVTHICCLGPLFLPLGIGGAANYVEEIISPWKPFFYFLMLGVLILVGWKTYGNPNSKKAEKLSFWFSAVILLFMVILG